MQTYKIGTRGSLLAVTQSTLMKNELEALSGDKFELVLIKTQGDQITNKPLWQLEGKDFFTKELDEALLKGEVDLVIHSYKDLGSVRPEGIKLGAITQRKFAHDILLIPEENIAKLKNWSEKFIVGTSSPRRIVNIQRKLKPYLPIQSDEVSIVCETLRGNVNSRIQKLRDGQYHAIVLALAGIERLATGEGSRDEIASLLKGLNFMILPQSVFPSAASQGALGIELLEKRSDNGRLHSIVSNLNHEGSIEEIKRERKAFKDFGGGCHLAVGIHVKKVGDHFLHVHSGEVDGKPVELKMIEGLTSPTLPVGKNLFIGLPRGERTDALYDEYLEKSPLKENVDLSAHNVFFTTRYAIETLNQSKKPLSLWAAGSKSAKILARSGHWVNGTSDSLGTDELMALRESKALNLIKDLQSEWSTLTHPDSQSDLGKVVPSYARSEKKVSSEFEERLKTVGACFWTSYPQYEAYLKRFSFLKDASHFCGLGKTWQEFKKNQVSVFPVASMQDFYDLKGKA